MNMLAKRILSSLAAFTLAAIYGLAHPQTVTTTVANAPQPALTGSTPFVNLTGTGALAFTTSASGGSDTTRGVVFKNNATGLTFKSTTGSLYDFTLLDPGNANYIARVPTGTQTFEVLGGVLSRSVPVAEVVCNQGAAQTAPLDTNEFTALTCAIPAATLGANGALRVTASFTRTNSANATTIRVKYGATTFFTLATGGYANIVTTTLIHNRGATNSQTSSTTYGTTSGAAGTLAPVTGAIDSTTAQNVVITLQKATGAEAAILDRVTVERLPSL